MLKGIKKVYFSSCLTIASAVVMSPSVMAADATGPDYTQITGAVDFEAVMTGIMAIAVAVAGLYVCVNGVKKLTAFLRSA
ncbi:hypothetical protein ABRP32_09045 [Providencia manganoxydans]|uniref:Phage-related membrane protein n=2 Tax=Providencia stuartii TaxID=588 RepID=A0AAI9D845_PROST|nr:hypothetical protein [Providencia stuartii]